MFRSPFLFPSRLPPIYPTTLFYLISSPPNRLTALKSVTMWGYIAVICLNVQTNSMKKHDVLCRQSPCYLIVS